MKSVTLFRVQALVVMLVALLSFVACGSQPSVPQASSSDDIQTQGFGVGDDESVDGAEGCTPGYWKQKHHFDDWANYAPEDSFAEVFGVPYEMTLLEALRAGGGKEIALGRHAVAALLNVNADNINYAYTDGDRIIELVQTAWENGEYEEIKDGFMVENERGCDFDEDVDEDVEVDMLGD